MRWLRFFPFLFVCGAASAASIAGVYNAGSWLPPALPNSGIAQGAIFTVTGTGLGPAALVQATSYPLPTTQGLGGTTVTVRVGPVAETCIMVYTVATQVAAILPSATPVGSGTLAVSYLGVTSSSAIQVVPGSFGMFTLNEGGTGPVVATDLQYNAITAVNAAHPGENLILWGTGLGAVSGNETEPPAAINFPGVQVLIGNQPAVVSYAGRSSSPGLDQINIVVPAGIPSGCKTSVGVMVDGVIGNVVMMAVSPVGQTTCGDTYGALTATNLQKATASGTLNIASVGLTRAGTDDDLLYGSFQSYPLNSLIRSYGGTFGSSMGSCVVYELAGSSLTILDPVQAPYLNAGPDLVISPQGRASATAAEIGVGEYDSAVGTSSSVFITPGSYTLNNGNGGTQVGPFSWGMTLPSPLAFTNFPSTVNRSQDLTVSWTNSAAFSAVSIFGFAGVPLSTSVTSYVEFVCIAPAASSQFTIPAAILSVLPTNGYGAPGVAGVGFQVAGVVENTFTVAGTQGIDAGIFTAFTSAGPVVKVQ